MKPRMRVLVATDGSEDACAAVTWLETFPLPPDADVLVLTVERTPYVSGAAFLLATEPTFHHSAVRIADDARDALRQRFPDAESMVLEGDPRELISRTAEDWGADLCVMGARGLGAVKAWLLGSVSTAVARWAPCPVLVVQGHPAPAIEKAVIALDGSIGAMSAARFFASLPLDPAIHVRLISAVESALVHFAARGIGLSEVRTMTAHAEARQAVTMQSVLRAAEQTFGDRVAGVERDVVVGRPADVIVEAAEQPDVGLVVMGARGLSALDRLLLGSVSEHVLHRAPCPVLIVRPDRRTKR
jgi:nucleotide-binding universal stress UspA family protein